MSDSLRHQELQQARLPFPSPALELTQTHVHQVCDVIQPSHLLSPLIMKSRRGVVVKHRLESERRGLKLNIQKTTESNKSLSMLLNQ